MPDKIYLTPKDGVSVLDPTTRQKLPPGGKEVDSSIYWSRRIADGDVTVGKPAAPAKASAKKSDNT